MKKKSKELWDQSAQYWAKNLSRGIDQTREKFGLPAFLNFLGDVQGKKILDAGCGDGAISRQLAQQGACMTGVDFSSQMIQIARHKETEKPLGIDYRLSSILSMTSTLESQSFDSIITYMVLCCCEDLRKFYREAFCLLKPQGSLFIAVPHPCFNNRVANWIKEGNNQVQGILIKEYFNESPYLRSWNFALNLSCNEPEEMQEVRYPWTLSTYLNGFVKSGFQLVGMDEPQPDLQSSKEVARLQRWQEHAACFLFIHAKKL